METAAEVNLPRAKRYLRDDADSQGITASQLKRTSYEMQRAYLKQWFHTYYSGTAVPPTSASPIPLPGPFDALDELEYEFLNVASEAAIVDTANELEADGIIYWNPKPTHPIFYADAKQASAISSRNRLQLARDLKQIERQIAASSNHAMRLTDDLDTKKNIEDHCHSLLSALRNIPQRPVGMGHNHPPLNAEDEAYIALDEVRQAALHLSSTVAQPGPAASVVVATASKLHRACGWLLKKFDIFTENYLKELGTRGAQATTVAGLVAFSVEARSAVHGIVHTASDAISLCVKWLSKAL